MPFLLFCFQYKQNIKLAPINIKGVNQLINFDIFFKNPDMNSTKKEVIWKL